VRRIGMTMGGQAGLFGVLTGSAPAPPASSTSADPAATAGGGGGVEDPAARQPAPGLADVVELPRRGGQGAADRRSAGKQRDR
jgi:hypothetical protein